MAGRGRGRGGRRRRRRGLRRALESPKRVLLWSFRPRSFTIPFIFALSSLCAVVRPCLSCGCCVVAAPFVCFVLNFWPVAPRTKDRSRPGSGQSRAEQRSAAQRSAAQRRTGSGVAHKRKGRVGWYSGCSRRSCRSWRACPVLSASAAAALLCSAPLPGCAQAPHPTAQFEDNAGMHASGLMHSALLFCASCAVLLPLFSVPQPPLSLVAAAPCPCWDVQTFGGSSDHKG
jgi:hypothetical protein